MCMLSKKIGFFLLFILLSTTLFAKTIHVLYFNDFHGQVDEGNKNPGMAKFASFVKAQEKKHPNYILVSGGDNYQGSVISNLTYGKPVNMMMKYLNVSASAVGNHEFDWTMKHFKSWQQEGGFSYLASNIFFSKTGRPVDFAKPYKIINKDGVKIAFIGLSTIETPSATMRKNVAGLTFQPGEKPAQQWIDYLKAGKDKTGKPNAIIALTHIPSKQINGKITGQELKNLIDNTHGLDAILSGHSHQPVAGRLDGMPVLQAYCYGRDLGDLKLNFNSKNRLIKVTPKLKLIYKHKKKIKPDPIMKKLYQYYAKQFKKKMTTKN